MEKIDFFLDESGIFSLCNATFSLVFTRLVQEQLPAGPRHRVDSQPAAERTRTSTHADEETAGGALEQGLSPTPSSGQLHQLVCPRG